MLKKGGNKYMEEELKARKKHFDSIFGTNTLESIDFNNVPILNELHSYFGEELYKPSPKFKQLRTESIKLLDKLEETFTEEQSKLFNKYMDIYNDMLDEESTQQFYFGCIIIKQLEKETNLKSSKN